jgi:hypothetical protein
MKASTTHQAKPRQKGSKVGRLKSEVGSWKSEDRSFLVLRLSLWFVVVGKLCETPRTLWLIKI